MPSFSSDISEPAVVKRGGVIIGGGRAAGADLARQIGVQRPQTIIAGAVAQVPAASLARRITGQATGNATKAVERQLQRWASGDRGVKLAAIDKLFSDYPGAANVPALASARNILAGAAPPLALPPDAHMVVHVQSVTRHATGAGQPEVRQPRWVKFPIRSKGGELGERTIDRALGDPIGAWLDSFQQAAPGIEILEVSEIRLTVEY